MEIEEHHHRVCLATYRTMFDGISVE